ncbi:hypothetical protein [Lichenicoccus sp.]|uniref:hypothetical protein n=1 Tax=Lichenicoccus sp. TaxID=2781899 RepID=UPI003D11983B
MRAVALAHRGIERREPGARHAEEIRLAIAASGRELQRDVAGTCRRQPCRVSHARLDIEAAPAALEERPGDGVRVRVRRPDIDIEALVDVAQGAPEQHVLEILGV